MAINHSVHPRERVRQGGRSYHKVWGWPDSAAPAGPGAEPGGSACHGPGM